MHNDQHLNPRQQAKQDAVLDAAVRGEIGSEEIDAIDIGGGAAIEELDDIVDSLDMNTPTHDYARNAFERFGGISYQDIDENLLRAGWENADRAGLTWDQAQDSIRDAYRELYDALELGEGGPDGRASDNT
jgi:hypothetical protein